jgi:hypothetical protein
MRIRAIAPTDLPADYANPIHNRHRAARSGQSTGTSEVLVLVLWCGTGLLLSLPFLPLLSKALADEDTFNLVAGLLG